MGTVKVTIDGKGNVVIEVEGVQGGGCLKETEELEKALGIINGNRKLKQEYYKVQRKVERRLGQ